MNQQAGKWIGIVAALAGVAIWQSGIFKGGMPSLPEIAQQQQLLSAEDEALTAKLQPFIQCINDVDANMRKNVGEYREFLVQHQEQNTGPDKARFRRTATFTGFKLKPYERDNQISKDCLKALNEGIAMKPADAALDQSGRSFATALEKLLPIMDTASAYYRQEDYKDDKLTKGKELDAQLSPLFDQLFMASGQIRETIRTHHDSLHERELAAMEKRDGKSFEWHTLNSMFHARRAIDAIGNAADAGKLTVEAVQAAEQRMQNALDGGRAHAQAHPNEKTPLGNKPLWFQIEGNIESYLSQIKELRRALSDKKSDNEVAGILSRVSDRFNGLVRNYNMIGKNYR